MLISTGELIRFHVPIWLGICLEPEANHVLMGPNYTFDPSQRSQPVTHRPISWILGPVVICIGDLYR